MPPRRSDVNWTQVAERVTFVPHQHASLTIDSNQAMDMLRCTYDDLGALITAGLPHATTPDAVLFDPCDLYNLGTYSNAGNTQPELAFKMLFRFMTAAPASLTTRREWSFHSTATCQGCTDRDSDHEWSIAAPATERFGGSSADVELTTNHASASLKAVVTNGGRTTPIVSDTVRRITAEFLDSGLRWQMLPAPMQIEFEAVHRLGVTNCISASLALAHSIQSVGYSAVARRGWFCGVLGGIMDLPHAWVEVIDDDGVTKAIDVATALLSLKVPHSQQFRDLCLGTPFNRVIASNTAADRPLATHACADRAEAVGVVTDIRVHKPAS